MSFAAYIAGLGPAARNILYIPQAQNDMQYLARVLLTAAIGLIIGTLMYAKLFIPKRTSGALDGRASLVKPSIVSSLWVYPIKSCRGIQVESIQLKLTGLEFDRNWMFVNADNHKFITMREEPKMTLINTQLATDSKFLKVSIQDTEHSVTIDTRPTRDWLESNCKLINVEIFDDKTDAWEYPATVNDTFTSLFGRHVKLVYKGPSPRLAGANAKPELYGKEVPHHFADTANVLIATETSLADLNERYLAKSDANEPLVMSRFRPNIVVKGNTAWEEDSWKSVRVTSTWHKAKQVWNVDLDVTNRCTRCTIPNVDPESAEKSEKEPFATLMSFRRIDHGKKSRWFPCFGMLCVPKREAVLCAGAEFSVLAMTDKHELDKAKFDEL